MSGTACKILLCWPRLISDAQVVNETMKSQYTDPQSPFKFDDATQAKLVELGDIAEKAVKEAYYLLVKQTGVY